VSGRTLGAAESGDARKMQNPCAANPLVRNAPTAPSWNGWSPNALTNTRYQTAKAADLSPAAVSRLQLKWAFGLPATYSAYGQPTIFDGHVFVGSDSGYLYSIDAASGCVHWSFQAQAGLRSTPMIAPAKPGSARMAAFFGDIRGNIYSLDATTGELLWKVSVDPHPLSRIMAAIKVYNGRVYVPVANRGRDDLSWVRLCVLHGARHRGGDRCGDGKADLEDLYNLRAPGSQEDYSGRQLSGAFGRECLGYAGTRPQTPCRLSFHRKCVLRT
jgi:hypothetical protein